MAPRRGFPRPLLRTHFDPGRGGRAGTETAATRQCPAFTVASANHRPAPPCPARRHRSPLRPEENLALVGHLRPTQSERAALPLRPARGKGLGGGRRGVPRGRVAHGEQDAPPPPPERGAVPLRRSSSRGRAARWRPRRRGQRHPGYRAGDGGGPSGSSQSPRDARRAAAGQQETSRPKKFPQAQGHTAAAAASAATRRSLADSGIGTPGPARGSQTLSPRGRAARAPQARPISCACPGGGAPLISQSAPDVPGPPLKSS